MMNVDNPPYYCCSPHRCLNTGKSSVGQSRGGWTQSLGRIPIGPASLPTALFVLMRELIHSAAICTAYDIQSLTAGDPAAVINAVRDGADEVGAAVVSSHMRWLTT